MVKAQIHTVDQLIVAFGGPTGLADWAGLGSTAIANWASRSFIPPGWHLRLYVEACRRGLSLDLEALFGLSSDEADVLRDTMARREPRRGDRARPTA
jgi:hypothetical protein